MAIPEQVRKQSEAVAKLYEDLNPDQTAASAADEGSMVSTTESAALTVPHRLLLRRRLPSTGESAPLTKT